VAIFRLFRRIRQRYSTAMSTLTIRPATPADIPAFTAIYAHSVRTGTASFELDPPDEAEMARRQAALFAGGFPYLAATDAAGAILGYAYAGPYRLRPAYRFSVEDSIYIAPDQHRRGIGKALLSALVVASETAGFRQMIAVIGDSANVPSVELHRAAGFHLIGTFAACGFKFGRWLDSVFMQRRLGDGADSPPDTVRRP
jgi:L-amino acid N-acyltransferase YncA